MRDNFGSHDFIDLSGWVNYFFEPTNCIIFLNFTV
jgi:hypothetical protein